MTINGVELSNILGHNRLVGAPQEHIRRQLAPYYRYIRRQVHPPHTQHFTLASRKLKPSFPCSNFAPNPKLTEIQDSSTKCRRSCGGPDGSAITSDPLQSPAFLYPNPSQLQNPQINSFRLRWERVAPEDLSAT